MSDATEKKAEPEKTDPAKPAPEKPEASTPPAVKADPKLVRVDREFKHGAPLFACRFDPLGRYVFAGAQDYLVQRWDLATCKAAPLAGHGSWVRAIAFTPDGQTTFTAGYDGRILFWDTAAEQPTPLRTIDAHQGWVRSLHVSPDGKLLASAGNDNLIKLWNTSDGSPVRQLAGHANHVYYALFHPSGQAIASCDLKGIVKHWDVSTGNVTRELTAPALAKYDSTFGADIGGARGMTFSPDGKWLVASGIINVSNAFAGIGDVSAALLDWESGKLVHQLVLKEVLRGVCWGVRFHPDGFIIGSSGGGGGGSLIFWKPDAAQEFFRFKLPANTRDMDLHPDGLRVAVAMHSGTLGIYSMTAKPKS